MDYEHQTLSRLTRLLAGLLLIASSLPFDAILGAPLWPWLSFGDAGPLDRGALLAPALAGLGLLWLSGRSLSKLALASGILGLCLLTSGLAFLSDLGSHPLGVFARLTAGLPDLFGRHLGLLLLAAVLMGAGLRLAVRAGEPPGTDPWPTGRAIAGLGVAALLLFYLLPHRGRIPLVALALDIGQFLPDAAEQPGLGQLSAAVLSLMPLLGALPVGWRLFRRPGTPSALPHLCLGFLPTLCLLVAFRALSTESGFALVHLRSATVLGALLAAAGVALPALIRSFWFEIPWHHGRLNAVDARLAIAPDSAIEIGRHPIARIYTHRRLALWRSAAATGRMDVALYLQQRAIEERNPDRDLPLPPPWPWWTGTWPVNTLASVALLAVLGVALGLARRPAPPSGPLGAADAAWDQALRHALPAAVQAIDLSTGHFHESDAYRELVHALGPLKSRWPWFAGDLLGLLDLGAEGRHRLHKMRRARDRLNLKLLEEGVPFYLQSTLSARAALGGDQFLLLAYQIEALRRFRLPGSELAVVLHLRRVDDLPVVETYMGVAEEEEPFVTLLLDRVTAFTRERVPPVLGRGDRIGLEAWRALVDIGADPDDLSPDGGPLREILLEALARHELHHRWLGIEPDPPRALWRFLRHYSEESVRGVTAEVGAYLAELGTLPAYGRLRLALMLDALDDPEGRRGLHALSTAFLLHHLLDLPSNPGDILGPALEEGALRLNALGDDELDLALGRLHEALFGVAIPRFEPVY